LKRRSIILRILNIVFVFTALLLLLCSCRELVELGIQDKGSSIEVEKGEEIKILLDSNPTTGYSWIAGEEIDTNIGALTDSKYFQMKSEEGMMGVGGFEVFTFEAKNSGQTEIVLYYMRPWEEEELKDEFIFNIDVTVK
jgi:inhibitor of cysteine peptidase